MRFAEDLGRRSAAVPERRRGLMSSEATGLLGIGLLLGLIALRIPIALAMILVGGGGFAFLAGPLPLLSQLKTIAYWRFSTYDLSVVPLFMLMGQFASRAGLSRDLFRAASAWVGHLRGGMAIGAIGACAGFGAICGSSLATASTMGQVALPELRRHGYAPALATGTLAAGGTLGILIPPSVILVIYAIIVETSIVTMFQAALIPGLLATLFFALTVRGYVALRPARGPGRRARELARAPRCDACDLAGRRDLRGGDRRHLRRPVHADRGGRDRRRRRRPDRADQRPAGPDRPGRLPARDRQGDRHDLPDPVRRRAAERLLRALPAAGRRRRSGSQQQQMPPMAVMLVLLLILIVFGCFMDSLSMIILAVPFFWPMLEGIDFGMTTEQLKVWFGIIALITVELGLITPPVGLNVFIIHGLAEDVPMSETFKGVVPFLLVELVRIGLLLAFPMIVLILPQLLG